jgi:hypothetical protein
VKNTLNEIPRYFQNNPNSKGFIFIDPYGYKEIKVRDIINLLKTGKTEIVLFLPIHYIYRFKDSTSQPEAIQDFLFDLDIGSKTYLNNQGVEFIADVTKGFRNKIGKRFYVDSFIIDRSKNQFFAIFFFSSSIYGFEKMIDAKWKIDNLEGRGWNSNLQTDLFSQFEKSANILKLNDILRNFIGDNVRTNAQIYEHTLRNGFRPTHAKETLQMLQNNGKIEVSNLQGKACRKGSFYLNYKCFKNEPQKALIKLK